MKTYFLKQIFVRKIYQLIHFSLFNYSYYSFLRFTRIVKCKSINNLFEIVYFKHNEILNPERL